MRSYKNKKRKERLSHIEDCMIGRWFSEHKVRLLRNVIHIQLHHEVNHFHLKTTFLHRTTIINRNYHHVTATTIVDYLINKQIKNVKYIYIYIYIYISLFSPNNFIKILFVHMRSFFGIKIENSSVPRKTHNIFLSHQTCC